jgi:hypothetical protein
VKYTVYAIQGVEFNTLEIEANSKEEAIAAYNKKWDGVEVYSVDYRDDKIEYVVEPMFRKQPKLTWLKPKVYKGKSMHEEELENQS